MWCSDWNMLSWQVDLSKEFGIPVQSQRFWLWAKRQNHTFRPVRPLTLQEEASSVSAILALINIILPCLTVTVHATYMKSSALISSIMYELTPCVPK